jgi:hypothetical protein
MPCENNANPYMARLRAKKKANGDIVRTIVALAVARRLNMSLRDVFDAISIDDCETVVSNHMKATKLNSRSHEGVQTH